jgi:hypothetical protein
MKFEQVRETYRVCCTRNEGSGLAWFKGGTWKLDGMRKNLTNGDALCRGEDGDLHILKCLEMRN